VYCFRDEINIRTTARDNRHDPVETHSYIVGDHAFVLTLRSFAPPFRPPRYVLDEVVFRRLCDDCRASGVPKSRRDASWVLTERFAFRWFSFSAPTRYAADRGSLRGETLRPSPVFRRVLTVFLFVRLCARETRSSCVRPRGLVIIMYARTAAGVRPVSRSWTRRRGRGRGIKTRVIILYAYK